MQVIWKLDSYYLNQYYENPQLFETNLNEMFPKIDSYFVHATNEGLCAYVNLKGTKQND